MRKIITGLLLLILLGSIYSQEVSPGGTRINRNEELNSSNGDVQLLSEYDMEMIQNHIEKNIGKIAKVFHELISEKVHIDICLVEPAIVRKYYTLVTMGMSTLPMNNPQQEYAYMELYLCLPPNWKLDDESIKKEENYWPIRLLKSLARFPYDYNDYLFYGHSMPNGDPSQPYAYNTKLSNVIIFKPQIISSDFALLKETDKTIFFLPIIPLYEEEMQFKLQTNLSTLSKLLGKYGITELLEYNRINVVTRSK
jgi:hypothetical protein